MVRWSFSKILVVRCWFATSLVVPPFSNYDFACKNPQTLGHVVGGCATHLNERRYKFRHNSVLLNLVKSIESVDSRTIYADIGGYSNPSIVTGDEYRPDLVVMDRNRI